MNLRETVINAAVLQYAKEQARLAAAMRRVAVDIALSAEGMPLLTQEEQAEIDAVAVCGELPFIDCDCEGGVCQRCSR